MSGPAADFRLLLVRHGETDANREFRMQGVSDMSLNEEGRRQLACTAERLSGEEIDAIYASDLTRAIESAEPIAARHGLTVRTDPRLREQNLGDWEGDVWFDLPEIYGQAALDSFMGDMDYGPPGGETKRSVLERFREAILEIGARHAGETVCVVTHGGPLMTFAYDAMRIPFGKENRFYAANGSVSEFERWDGFWRLVTLNETHFLGARPEPDPQA
ncbi:MAG: histidine phosphatase family protein [Planctomycetota bacterium]